MQLRIFLILLVSVAYALFAPVLTAQQSPEKPRAYPPTFEDVSYDSYIKTKLDFWQAQGEGPRPLVILIHGGGWAGGDKKMFGRAPGKQGLGKYLKEGISVAAISYRLTITDPLPTPVHDAARAVQFLRSKAEEWNLDKERFAAIGNSSGGCSAMWLLLHDDIANPDSEDPIERESSRLAFAVGTNTQPTVDPVTLKSWVGLAGIQDIGMLNRMVGAESLEIEHVLANYEQYKDLYYEFSPINHLDSEDPPLLLIYLLQDPEEDEKLPAIDGRRGIHHPYMGFKMKEKAYAVGADLDFYVLKSKDRRELKESLITDFLRKHFFNEDRAFKKKEDSKLER